MTLWYGISTGIRRRRRSNELDHFRVETDGLPINYIHVRSGVSEPTPLLLNHGWLWTFWDFRQIIKPLTDARFDFVIPSLPGFAYSTSMPRTGVGFVDTADAFGALMTAILGYDRFADPTSGDRATTKRGSA